ncbi:hypothetical protein C8A05DRAFT_34356 [Staphylotrichum tortipilum]|uniref:Chromo domain-containing protein n=1 Tax=Staphylotrichum tortipilum TaxID=2831512 RepID=A0AAN6RTW6_9PEZI|nr:hypothetical protein C8A05DRAFT_34356 [Staphylotrichum longicolle]
MFKISPTAAFGDGSPDGDESDDNISLTSTVSGHDSDQEFGVESILAEELFDGNMYYLVEWTGFPLHQSTWEPEANLGSELKAMWEEDKAKHAAGELELFDIQKFENARKLAKKEKAERHHRRNCKRGKLGLTLTPPFADPDSSDEEAVEEAVEAEVADSAPANQQKVQNAVPATAPLHAGAATPAVGSAPPQDEARQSMPAAREPTESSLANQREQTARPQPTGYQGTARRPSKPSSTDSAPKSKTRPAVTIPRTTAPTISKPSLGARKTLTAKKSTAQPAGNIFTSGKPRRQRANLGDAMSDTTKTPQLFDKHRQRRLVQLRSREKEDIAPDASKLQLFDLRSGQSVGRRGSAGPVLSPTRLPSPQGGLLETPTAVEPPQVTAQTSPKPTANVLDTVAPKKKRKSVRFLDEDDDEVQLVIAQEPEQMDLDIPAAGLSHRPTPPAKETRNSTKTLIFGRSSIKVTLNGLPCESADQPSWLSRFLAAETLEFKHSCFAKTAAAQLGVVVQDLLASGILVSQEDATLGRVAEYLTGGLLAICCLLGDYNVLVYPINCEEWKSIAGDQNTIGTPEAALGYMIFSSSQNCRLILPPLTVDPEFQAAPGGDKREQPEKDKNEPSARGQMVGRLFDFDYNKLLPRIPNPLPVHSFFLAIPDSRKEIGQALYHWLRATNPDCKIFTSQHAGGWVAFRAQVEHIPGVVIIHEMLAWSMRRFPHLGRYLVSRNDEYWCFSEPVNKVPLYPSISEPKHPLSPGDMRLVRLFPYRTVIFLTPSFFVSEPQRSLEFLEWFRGKWGGSFHFRLVTAFNIPDYLSELADERYQARQHLLNNTSGDSMSEREAERVGLGREDFRSRYLAAQVASELDMVRTVTAGAFAHDEDNSQLIYADSSIDPNDEQSLINWFGWWATLRADQFRKFHVIGSGRTITRESRRGERQVRIPKYTKVTLNDPDAVLEVLQERNDQIEAAEGDEDNSGGRRAQLSPDDDDKKMAGFKQGPWSFQSNLIRMEDPASFASYLESLETLDGFRLQWILFRFPVSWLDFEMAEHFGDFSAKFSRIHDWFNFAFPFGACYNGKGPRRTPFSYNTYVGFFYTIDTEWDSDNPPPRESPERHPWIAVYRPVCPHKKPYGRCELIIWDPAARTRYPDGKAPAERDLIFMQRQLIQHVREHCDEKNNGTWLDQVWFGGWEWPEDCDSPYPNDVTLQYLRRMLGEIRSFLPAPEPVMERTPYRRVREFGITAPRRPPAIQPSPPRAAAAAPTSRARSDTPESALFVDRDGSELMDLDLPTQERKPGSDRPPSSEAEDDEHEHARIIFHPPRGHTSNNNGSNRPRSRCVNHLYEKARIAQARAPGATTMQYRFPPTMEWYAEQKAEGRGFAHLNVDSWEGVFRTLKIGGDEGGREGGNGAGGGREG